MLPDGTQRLHRDHDLAQAAEREAAQRKMKEPVRRQGGWLVSRDYLEDMDRNPHDFYSDTDSDENMEDTVIHFMQSDTSSITYPRMTV